MQRAQQAQVNRIVNICTDPETLKRGFDLEKRYPIIRNAGATTPHDVEKEGEEAFEVFERAAKEGLLVAIGETGLEYYYKELDREIQKKFLIRYLRLAQETKLPVIFHCREAFRDLFAIADGEYPKELPAILHCFTGSREEAEGVISRGWYLSFSGIVTYKRSEALRDVARWAPLDRILIETDSPYLAPQTKRGKENEPSYILETAKVVAESKGIDLEAVAQASFENGCKLFRM